MSLSTGLGSAAIPYCVGGRDGGRTKFRPPVPTGVTPVVLRADSHLPSGPAGRECDGPPGEGEKRRGGGWCRGPGGGRCAGPVRYGRGPEVYRGAPPPRHPLGDGVPPGRSAPRTSSAVRTGPRGEREARTGGASCSVRSVRRIRPLLRFGPGLCRPGNPSFTLSHELVALSTLPSCARKRAPSKESRSRSGLYLRIARPAPPNRGTGAGGRSPAGETASPWNRRWCPFRTNLARPDVVACGLKSRSEQRLLILFGLTLPFRWILSGWRVRQAGRPPALARPHHRNQRRRRHRGRPPPPRPSSC